MHLHGIYNNSNISNNISNDITCMTSVQKVSVHFEYLENWSRGLDVTGQPVRGDLDVQP